MEEFISIRDGGGLVDALSAVDQYKALGGVVASMSEFDLDKVVEKRTTRLMMTTSNLLAFMQV